MKSATVHCNPVFQFSPRHPYPSSMGKSEGWSYTWQEWFRHYALGKCKPAIPLLGILKIFSVLSVEACYCPIADFFC